jgi:uncharacterized protein with PQ loop repeat
VTATALLGGAGTVVGLIRALPQFVRLLKARDAAGVSVDTAATSAAISFGWATYGAATEQLPVALATLSSGIVFLGITVLALRFGRRVTELKAAPIWALVLGGAYVLGGSGALGVLLPLSVLVGNLPQVITTYREFDLSGLSLATWLFSVTDGIVWALYALFARDLSILVFGVLQMTTSGLIVARRLVWGRTAQAEEGRAATGVSTT